MTTYFQELLIRDILKGLWKSELLYEQDLPFVCLTSLNKAARCAWQESLYKISANCSPVCSVYVFANTGFCELGW